MIDTLFRSLFILSFLLLLLPLSTLSCCYCYCECYKSFVGSRPSFNSYAISCALVLLSSSPSTTSLSYSSSFSSYFSLLLSPLILFFSFALHFLSLTPIQTLLFISLSLSSLRPYLSFLRSALLKRFLLF